MRRPQHEIARFSPGWVLLALATTLPRAGADTLGFDASAAETLSDWRLQSDDPATGLDDEVVYEGTHSLRVVAIDGEGGRRFSRRLAVPRTGDRIRISAYARNEGPNAAPEIWIRVGGDRGLLYVDRTSPTLRDDRWERVTIEAPLSARAESIEIGGDVRGSGTVWFDSFSIEPLAASELPDPAAVATRYLSQSLDIMQQHSLRTREIDWQTFRAAALAQARGARDAEDAHLAVQFALGELADGHSYFMSPRQMSRLDDGPVSNARTGRAPVSPRSALLASGAGYIQVPGFAGGEQRAQMQFAVELQSVIRDLDTAGACGFIVDLRDNRGGNLWPMLVGLGPLLTQGESGAAVYPDSTRQAFWYRDGKAGLGDAVQLRVHEPYVPERTPSVAVLTGRSTASAGEILAAAFRAEPSARSFGAPTRGAHTSTRVFPLYDGAALVLAVAATSNRLGEIFTGPIEPDQPVAVSVGSRAARPLEEDPVATAAAHWLASMSECG